MEKSDQEMWADADEEGELVETPKPVDERNDEVDSPKNGEDEAESKTPESLSRSERKRDREKKRRDDLNKGFDRLQNLIFGIDPEVKEEADERIHRSRGNVEEHAVFSRLELIHHAINTLEKVNQENEERKMVIQHMARGLLAGDRSGGILPEVAASLAPPLNSAAPSFPPHHHPPPPQTLRDIPDMQRQELEQKIKLEAAIAAARQQGVGGMDPSFSRPNPLPEALLGLGSPSRRAPAPIAHHPPPLGADPSFGGRHNQLAAAQLLQQQQQQLGAAGDFDRQTAAMGGDPAIYRARLNRLLQEQGEQSALAAAAAGYGSSGGGLPGGGSLGGNLPVRHSGDSIRQAMFREQALAAAARAQGGAPPDFMDPYGQASKRRRNF